MKKIRVGPLFGKKKLACWRGKKNPKLPVSKGGKVWAGGGYLGKKKLPVFMAAWGGGGGGGGW